MSNNRDALSPISRAVVAGALVGTTTSCIEQWRRYQRGETMLNESAVKVVSGAVMAVASASASAGRPLLTWLTLASAGVASLYVLDAMQRRESLQDQPEEGAQ
ncbi:MAG: hypothetical protein ACMZI0_17960 [Symbiopectobacterium sp.]|uniref:hypothetical protein n=1 Tax=Symbiopectobacterium sp. TaxID=2952789 RepID=UPI0039EC2867